MKALVGAFNQEKALVGACSVIVQPVVEPMDRFVALGYSSSGSTSVLITMMELLLSLPRLPPASRPPLPAPGATVYLQWTQDIQCSDYLLQ